MLRPAGHAADDSPEGHVDRSGEEDRREQDEGVLEDVGDELGCAVVGDRADDVALEFDWVC